MRVGPFVLFAVAGLVGCGQAVPVPGSSGSPSSAPGSSGTPSSAPTGTAASSALPTAGAVPAIRLAGTRWNVVAVDLGSSVSDVRAGRGWVEFGARGINPQLRWYDGSNVSSSGWRADGSRVRLLGRATSSTVGRAGTSPPLERAMERAFWSAGPRVVGEAGGIRLESGTTTLHLRRP